MSSVYVLENDFPIHCDPKFMNGVPVFIETRVPVCTLFDYLLDGRSVAEFLDNFPSVKKLRWSGIKKRKTSQIG